MGIQWGSPGVVTLRASNPPPLRFSKSFAFLLRFQLLDSFPDFRIFTDIYKWK